MVSQHEYFVFVFDGSFHIYFVSIHFSHVPFKGFEAENLLAFALKQVAFESPLIFFFRFIIRQSASHLSGRAPPRTAVQVKVTIRNTWNCFSWKTWCVVCEVNGWKFRRATRVMYKIHRNHETIRKSEVVWLFLFYLSSEFVALPPASSDLSLGSLEFQLHISFHWISSPFVIKGSKCFDAFGRNSTSCCSGSCVPEGIRAEASSCVSWTFGTGESARWRVSSELWAIGPGHHERFGSNCKEYDCTRQFARKIS